MRVAVSVKFELAIIPVIVKVIVAHILKRSLISVAIVAIMVTKPKKLTPTNVKKSIATLSPINEVKTRIDKKISLLIAMIVPQIITFAVKVKTSLAVKIAPLYLTPLNMEIISQIAMVIVAEIIAIKIKISTFEKITMKQIIAKNMKTVSSVKGFVEEITPLKMKIIGLIRLIVASRGGLSFVEKITIAMVRIPETLKGRSEIVKFGG